MKPEIYAAKKAIVLIPIAMMRIIRSSVVIPANMTQDSGITFEYIVVCRAPKRSLRGYGSGCMRNIIGFAIYPSRFSPFC